MYYTTDGEDTLTYENIIVDWNYAREILHHVEDGLYELFDEEHKEYFEQLTKEGQQKLREVYDGIKAFIGTGYWN